MFEVSFKNGDKEVKCVLGYFRGVHVTLCLSPEESPIAGYTVLDDGEIRDLWVDPQYRGNVDLVRLYEESLVGGVRNGVINPNSGYLYSTVHVDNVTAQKARTKKQLGWQEDIVTSENGEKWKRHYITINELANLKVKDEIKH